MFIALLLFARGTCVTLCGVNEGIDFRLKFLPPKLKKNHFFQLLKIKIPSLLL